ncbi:hypothetical protein BDW66DRAFT_160538 [Aspergillus desertorum]
MADPSLSRDTPSDLHNQHRLSWYPRYVSWPYKAPSASFLDVEPPLVIGPATKKAISPPKGLPQSLIQGARYAKKEAFGPSKHLNFQPPKTIYTMEQVGLEGHGISSRAAVLAECQYSSTFNKHTIHGMGPPCSLEVIARILEVAGMDVVPSVDYEIANINISIRDESINSDAKLKTISHASDEELPTVARHHDSFPFVCVTMLSDCTGMAGGQTAPRTPSGEIMKIRGPAMPNILCFAGRRRRAPRPIHRAPSARALGGRERISIVTCFRPGSPRIKDKTVLVGVGGISDLNDCTEVSKGQVRFLESMQGEILEVE